MSTANVTVDIKRGDGTLIQTVVVTQTTPSLVQLGAGSPSQGLVDEAGLNTVNTELNKYLTEIYSKREKTEELILKESTNDS